MYRNYGHGSNVEWSTIFNRPLVNITGPWSHIYMLRAVEQKRISINNKWQGRPRVTSEHLYEFRNRNEKNGLRKCSAKLWFKVLYFVIIITSCYSYYILYNYYYVLKWICLRCFLMYHINQCCAYYGWDPVTQWHFIHLSELSLLIHVHKWAFDSFWEINLIKAWDSL